MVTIPAIERRKRYNPVVATTTFPVLDVAGNAIALFSLDDVSVWVDGVEQVDNFTVTGTFANNVCMNAVVVANTPGWTGVVDIVADRSPSRTDQFADGRGVPANDINLALNRLSGESREHYDALERAWKSEFGVDGGRITAGRDGTVPMYDADGNMVEGPYARDVINSEALGALILAAGAGLKFHTLEALAAFNPPVGSEPRMVTIAGAIDDGDLGEDITLALVDYALDLDNLPHPGFFPFSGNRWYEDNGKRQNVWLYKRAGETYWQDAYERAFAAQIAAGGEVSSPRAQTHVCNASVPLHGRCNWKVDGGVIVKKVDRLDDKGNPIYVIEGEEQQAYRIDNRAAIIGGPAMTGIEIFQPKGHAGVVLTPTHLYGPMMVLPTGLDLPVDGNIRIGFRDTRPQDPWTGEMAPSHDALLSVYESSTGIAVFEPSLSIPVPTNGGASGELDATVLEIKVYPGDSTLDVWGTGSIEGFKNPIGVDTGVDAFPAGGSAPRGFIARDCSVRIRNHAFSKLSIAAYVIGGFLLVSGNTVDNGYNGIDFKISEGHMAAIGNVHKLSRHAVDIGVADANVRQATGVAIGNTFLGHSEQSEVEDVMPPATFGPLKAHPSCKSLLAVGNRVDGGASVSGGNCRFIGNDFLCRTAEGFFYHDGAAGHGTEVEFLGGSVTLKRNNPKLTYSSDPANALYGRGIFASSATLSRSSLKFDTFAAAQVTTGAGASYYASPVLQQRGDALRFYPDAGNPVADLPAPLVPHVPYFALPYDYIIPYVTRTGAFTAGQIVTQATTGATAKIVAEDATTQSLLVTDVTGTFTPGLALTDPLGGAALSPPSSTSSTAMFIAQKLSYDAQTANFTPGETVTGSKVVGGVTQTATGKIAVMVDGGATGDLYMRFTEVQRAWLDDMALTAPSGGAAVANIPGDRVYRRRLATTRDNAIAGTFIPLTTGGDDTMTATPSRPVLRRLAICDMTFKAQDGLSWTPGTTAKFTTEVQVDDFDFLRNRVDFAGTNLSTLELTPRGSGKGAFRVRDIDLVGAGLRLNSEPIFDDYTRMELSGSLRNNDTVSYAAMGLDIRGDESKYSLSEALHVDLRYLETIGLTAGAQVNASFFRDLFFNIDDCYLSASSGTYTYAWRIGRNRYKMPVGPETTFDARWRLKGSIRNRIGVNTVTSYITTLNLDGATLPNGSTPAARFFNDVLLPIGAVTNFSGINIEPSPPPVPNVVLRNYLTGSSWFTKSPPDTSWQAVAYAPKLGLLAAVGSSGAGNRAMTSPDGQTWTARTTPADNDWIDVCWSPELGLFCAVAPSGTGNRVMTSPDGVNWTIHSSAADNDWSSICWSPERRMFVAVANTGTGNRVMISLDGTAWSTRSSAADNSWFAICWSPDLLMFCAVANSGTGNRVMTSSDGSVWTAQQSAADNNWRGVCWSPKLGLFCAVANSGTGNRVMTSPDGVTWTAQTSAADNSWTSVCWSPELGLFVAVGFSGAGNRIMTSPDGIAWTLRSSAADNTWRDVVWVKDLGIFVVVGSTGTGDRVMVSKSVYTYPWLSS